MESNSRWILIFSLINVLEELQFTSLINGISKTKFGLQMTNLTLKVPSRRFT